MRTLLVGDVHGCAEPLRALVRDVRPDALILLGDVFNKGPDPAGVWDVIRAHDARGVLGNHDARVLGARGTEGDDIHHAAARALPDEAFAWLEALPVFLPGDGWLCVHAGVHPTEGRAGTTRRMALTMRRWPDDQDLDNPFWWELYTGETRIYYGHDAVRGLRKRERTLGLDSGAVYGGLLSGYILEEDRVVQVDGWVSGPGW